MSMVNDQHWLEGIASILEAETDDLRELAKVAGFSPETFYIGVDMGGDDLRGQNLKGMQFTNFDLSNVKIDEKTVLPNQIDVVRELSNEVPSRLLRHAIQMFEQGNFLNAATLLAELLSYKNLKPPEAATALLYLGRTETKLGNLEKGKGLLKRSRSIFQREDNRIGMASVYRGLSELSEAQGRMYSAYDRMKDCLKISEEIEPGRQEWADFDRLASIAEKMGNRSATLDWLMKSLERRRLNGGNVDPILRLSENLRAEIQKAELERAKNRKSDPDGAVYYGGHWPPL